MSRAARPVRKTKEQKIQERKSEIDLVSFSNDLEDDYKTRYGETAQYPGISDIAVNGSYRLVPSKGTVDNDKETTPTADDIRLGLSFFLGDKIEIFNDKKPSLLKRASSGLLTIGRRGRSPVPTTPLGLLSQRIGELRDDEKIIFIFTPYPSARINGGSFPVIVEKEEYTVIGSQKVADLFDQRLYEANPTRPRTLVTSSQDTDHLSSDYILNIGYAAQQLGLNPKMVFGVDTIADDDDVKYECKLRTALAIGVARDLENKKRFPWSENPQEIRDRLDKERADIETAKKAAALRAAEEQRRRTEAAERDRKKNLRDAGIDRLITFDNLLALNLNGICLERSDLAFDSEAFPNTDQQKVAANLERDRLYQEKWTSFDITANYNEDEILLILEAASIAQRISDSGDVSEQNTFLEQVRSALKKSESHQDFSREQRIKENPKENGHPLDSLWRQEINQLAKNILSTKGAIAARVTTFGDIFIYPDGVIETKITINGHPHLFHLKKDGFVYNANIIHDYPFVYSEFLTKLRSSFAPATLEERSEFIEKYGKEITATDRASFLAIGRGKRFQNGFTAKINPSERGYNFYKFGNNDRAICRVREDDKRIEIFDENTNFFHAAVFSSELEDFLTKNNGREEWNRREELRRDEELRQRRLREIENRERERREEREKEEAAARMQREQEQQRLADLDRARTEAIAAETRTREAAVEAERIAKLTFTFDQLLELNLHSILAQDLASELQGINAPVRRNDIHRLIRELEEKTTDRVLQSIIFEAAARAQRMIDGGADITACTNFATEVNTLLQNKTTKGNETARARFVNNAPANPQKSSANEAWIKKIMRARDAILNHVPGDAEIIVEAENGNVFKILRDRQLQRVVNGNTLTFSADLTTTNNSVEPEAHYNTSVHAHYTNLRSLQIYLKNLSPITQEEIYYFIEQGREINPQDVLLLQNEEEFYNGYVNKIRVDGYRFFEFGENGENIVRIRDSKIEILDQEGMFCEIVSGIELNQFLTENNILLRTDAEAERIRQEAIRTQEEATRLEIERQREAAIQREERKITKEQLLNLNLSAALKEKVDLALRVHVMQADGVIATDPRWIDLTDQLQRKSNGIEVITKDLRRRANNRTTYDMLIESAVLMQRYEDLNVTQTQTNLLAIVNGVLQDGVLPNVEDSESKNAWRAEINYFKENIYDALENTAVSGTIVIGRGTPEEISLEKEGTRITLIKNGENCLMTINPDSASLIVRDTTTNTDSPPQEIEYDTYGVILSNLQLGFARINPISAEIRTQFIAAGREWTPDRTTTAREFSKGYLKDVNFADQNYRFYRTGKGVFRVSQDDEKRIDILGEDKIFHTAVSQFQLNKFLEKYQEPIVFEKIDRNAHLEYPSDAKRIDIGRDNFFLKNTVINNDQDRTDFLNADCFLLTAQNFELIKKTGVKRNGEKFLNDARFARVKFETDFFLDPAVQPVGANFVKCYFDNVDFRQLTPKTLRSLIFQDCKFGKDCLFPVGFKFGDQFRSSEKDHVSGKITIKNAKPPKEVQAIEIPDDKIHVIEVSKFASLSRNIPRA